MPNKKITVRYSFSEKYDLLVITFVELVPIEDREYRYARHIVYTPVSDNLPKITVI